MHTEQTRLLDEAWRKWGPYVSDRQWGTVREDYSEHGNAWNYTTHDMARSLAYRWGEEGIAGISDDKQFICFALALWNKKDPIIKERYFGLSNGEGNHGEDVKDQYYYLDATPSHSYMKMLYKYPQQAFPYNTLVHENRNRSRKEPEFELIDTGIFDDNKYFDVFVEYAKASTTDILIKITVFNRGEEDASLHILPTIWFRNRWVWSSVNGIPAITVSGNGNLALNHEKMGSYTLYTDTKTELLFCDNETNHAKIYGKPNNAAFCKDGINNYLVNADVTAVNRANTGTKAAVNYDVTIAAGGSHVIKLRLSSNTASSSPFHDFDSLFAARQKEADKFYADIQKGITSDDERNVQRQAFAGMVWSKQFYYYDLSKWLNGDAALNAPPEQRKHGRNKDWKHLNNADIISMPDKWEYPWYASWDLAFHCIPFAMIDPIFAKQQLKLLTKEWYMQPNGQLPAYEWNFSDVNPPVHAWATFRVFKIDEHRSGKPDVAFLESVFHKLLLNFTWWVNRKDREGNNIFEGGFLGLDNIGVFDRSAQLPTGGHLEQADATSWMAMYSLNMLRISLELARYNPVYQDMATKFFEHFLYIAEAMDNMGDSVTGLWDEEDGFFYDVLRMPNHQHTRLKVRSMVGLIPFFAVEVLDHELLMSMPKFTKRLQWLYDNKPHLAKLVARWDITGSNEKHLLSLLKGHRMKKLLARMLDEAEFLSEHGIRSFSKFYHGEPYRVSLYDETFEVKYTPGESDSDIFGGNSNWRGPVWMPMNFLIIESLQRFHYYYGDDFKVECPKGSGCMLSLNEIADMLSRRLSKLLLHDENGNRPAYADCLKQQQDPFFKNYILFHEYFDGDTGKGLGASHQTGWTGLIARLLHRRENPVKK